MGNSKVDEFKMFVKANPFLIDYIKKGKKSWQDLYEIYDIYGSDEEYWNNDNDSYFLHHFATRLGNKGIGSVMLEFAYQKCLEDGKEYLRLDSWGSNDGLTKYYENMNFVNVKTGKKGVYKYKLWEKKVKK